MLRIRVAGMLLLVVALLAAACGDDAPGVPTDGGTSTPDASSTDTEPSGSGSVAPVEDDASDDSSSGDEGSAAVDSDAPDDAAPSEDRQDTAPAAAEALLAAATTELDGRSVRGVATIELAPGLDLSTSFESDADGDLAATVEIPPGLDPEFPGGADAEVRYVGDLVYVRSPVPAEILAELGVDEAWYVVEPVAGGDPMSGAMQSAGGVLCVFPQSLDVPADDCDLLGEAGTFLEAAGEAEIVGREDVRGVEATRVRFGVSLLDLAGEALGMAPDAGDDEASEGGAFDDSASDPFAEGLEQILGFLDAELEVEVWIDDENLIRRLTFDLASMFAGLAGPDDEVPSSLITLEFFDFDADISVEAPPPDSIVDRSLILGDDDFASSEEYEPEYDDYDEPYDEPSEPGP